MVWAKHATMATAFGQPAVRDRPHPDRLTRAWVSTQNHLPEGWRLDGLLCASTGLPAESRFDDWVEIAVGPSGKERSHRAPGAVGALEGLAEEFDADLPGTYRCSASPAVK
jgi:hypothetical protein